MIPATPLSFVVSAAALALGGYGLGLLYFAMLRRTIGLLTAGGGWVRPLALTLSRLVAATAVFGLVAVAAGALAVAALLAGFLVARTVAIHRARRNC